MKTQHTAENDFKRSEFIYSFLNDRKESRVVIEPPSLPKTNIRFWHNLKEIPDDVLECMVAIRVISYIYQVVDYLNF